MAETVGLIERAAALLRQQEATEPAVPIAPRKATGGPALTAAGPELVLDRGRLAGFGIAIPSAARSRTVEEFRLVKRNLAGAWSLQTRIKTHPGGQIDTGQVIEITAVR